MIRMRGPVTTFALVSELCAIVAPGCGGSSDDDSSGGTGGGTGGTLLGGSGGVGGTSASGGTGGLGATGAKGGTGGKDAATCPLPLPSGWAPVPLKPNDIQLGSCSPQHISDYVTKCIQYNKPPCPEFAAAGDTAKEKCEACFWSNVTDATWSAAVTLGTGAAISNQSACLLMENGSAAQACADAQWERIQCQSEACKTCTDEYGNINQDCQDESDTGVCEQYAQKVTACQTFQNSKCFGTDLEQTAGFVVNLFCGTGWPAPDGGTDAGTDAPAEAATDASSD